jgi:hypothetical protein
MPSEGIMFEARADTSSGPFLHAAPLLTEETVPTVTTITLAERVAAPLGSASRLQQSIEETIEEGLHLGVSALLTTEATESRPEASASERKRPHVPRVKKSVGVRLIPPFKTFYILTLAIIGP